MGKFALFGIEHLFNGWAGFFTKSSQGLLSPGLKRGSAPVTPSVWVTLRKSGHTCSQLLNLNSLATETAMTTENFPSSDPTHRRMDLIVHIFGLVMILTAGGVLVYKTANAFENTVVLAVVLYAVSALLSNVASCFYHFMPWHERRTLLRRIDHAAIYLSITGTFTPFFVLGGTTWTFALLWICWGLTFVAIWNKVTSETVKSRWSTASYLGLGAIGLSALPDLTNLPVASLWCIIGGSACYVVGTAFYVRKTMPFRYAIWHTCVTIGGAVMFAGVWMAVFA